MEIIAMVSRPPLSGSGYAASGAGTPAARAGFIRPKV
jgi:hypothetical protein